MNIRIKWIEQASAIVIKILTIISFVSMPPACNKLVQVPAPISSVNAANAYSSDATAIAVLTGIYVNLSDGATTLASGKNSMSYLAGLSADEFTLYSGVPISSPAYLYYTNALTNISGVDFWNSLYSVLFTINSAFQGVSGSTSLTPAVKQQLLGESLFLRALCYFYLVNLYGDVPLVTGTDYTVNSLLSRTSKTIVWQQVITDLKNAELLLSNNFLDGSLIKTTTERIRPTKWAASALLARAYLYTGDWPDAKTQADSLINNIAPFPLSLVYNLDHVFLRDSTEAIWQLQPVYSSPANTSDAYYFILPATGPNAGNNSAFLSNELLASFETGDLRRVHWVDSVIAGGTTYYFPYKYKVNSTFSGTPVTEYTMVFRLAEQYLIRAEAEANGAGNGIGGAINDLNIIRNRAGLAVYAGATDQGSILSAILHERQVELFTEWGHRWLDLKRTGMVDAVMAPVCNTIKGGSWNSNWQYYPIPLASLQTDPNLTQNSGY